MPYDLPVLLRFLAKWVLDVLPAALASVIGGFLVTHYQAARAVAPAPAAEQAAPASAQMLRLVPRRARLDRRFPQRAVGC